MKIFLEHEDKWIEKTNPTTVSELLERLNINPQTVLVLKNQELVTEDEQLVEEDEIKVLTVVSGG